MSRAPSPRCAQPLALAIVAAILGGCVGETARRDAISPWAGDTQAQVIAAQAINPWPKAAYDKTWRSRPTPAAGPAPITAPAPAADLQ